MTRFYKVMYFLLARPARLLFRIKLRGRENIPEKGGYLVCSNHISLADPILISAPFPEQICYMSKRETFRIPLLGWFIRGLGAYPVDRSGGNVGAVKNSIALLKSGKCVGIFPQGTRCPGKDIGDTPVKTGCAMIAVRAGVPVVPVYIRSKGQKFHWFSRNEVIVGRPLSPEDLAYDPEKSGEYARVARLIGDAIGDLREV